MALFHAAQAVPLDPGGDPGGLPGSSHSSKCQGILIRRLGLIPPFPPLTHFIHHSPCVSPPLYHYPPSLCGPPPIPYMFLLFFFTLSCSFLIYHSNLPFSPSHPSNLLTYPTPLPHHSWSFTHHTPYFIPSPELATILHPLSPPLMRPLLLSPFTGREPEAHHLTRAAMCGEEQARGG